MDLSHSRPHKKFTHAPVKPFNRFLSAVDIVVSNCPHRRSAHIGPPATVKHGDARRLSYASESIDLVLTSPPYLNAIDYIRCSKFSLIWMGYKVSELREIRSNSVGTESKSEIALGFELVTSVIRSLRLNPVLSSRNHALLATYIWDMNEALSEVSRVLRHGGRAVYVVGDCVSRGTFISNSSIVTAVAEKNGLSLVSRQTRNLPANRRYLPPPTNRLSTASLDSRLRREIILSFKKG
jgi:DNA modification methylase